MVLSDASCASKTACSALGIVSPPRCDVAGVAREPDGDVTRGDVPDGACQ